ncbi:hypothetical protein ACFL5O_03240 [Myxococcota bacterium]
MKSSAAFLDTAGWIVLAEAADDVHGHALSFCGQRIEPGGVLPDIGAALALSLTAEI